MRIAVDLDDVIADLIPCMLAKHREITGAALTREQATSWNVFPPEVHDSVRFGNSYGSLELLPGAVEFLSWLKERHEVHIVTYRGEHSREITTRWLERHLPGLYDGVHFSGGGKVDICRELEVDLIIDDSYNQIPAVSEALGIPGILMDTPMNRHIREAALVRRASDLQEARVIIEDLVAHGRSGRRGRRDAAADGDAGA